MKLSTQIKTISYLKAHAAEIIRGSEKQEDPLIITQNGEAIMQGLESCEKTQETLALLQILALGTNQIEQGKVQSARDVIQDLISPDRTVRR